jgi:hypothetical protein
MKNDMPPPAFFEAYHGLRPVCDRCQLNLNSKLFRFEQSGRLG